jgi:hypothetical protein
MVLLADTDSRTHDRGPHALGGEPDKKHGVPFRSVPCTSGNQPECVFLCSVYLTCLPASLGRWLPCKRRHVTHRDIGHRRDEDRRTTTVCFLSLRSPPPLVGTKWGWSPKPSPHGTEGQQHMDMVVGGPDVAPSVMTDAQTQACFQYVYIILRRSSVRASIHRYMVLS